MIITPFEVNKAWCGNFEKEVPHQALEKEGV
jgi:hypothetical protein